LHRFARIQANTLGELQRRENSNFTSKKTLIDSATKVKPKKRVPIRAPPLDFFSFTHIFFFDYLMVKCGRK